MDASVFGDVATWVGSLGTLLALIVAATVALVQLRTQRRQERIQRTLTAHRDITSGEGWAARDRLSEYMWRMGSTAGKIGCRRPTWAELSGPGLSSGVIEQDLSRYPLDIQPVDGKSPLRDLYLLFWHFERIGVAHRSGLLDHELAVSMMASHIVWWDVFCHRIDAGNTRYRQSLHDLAAVFDKMDPTLRAWAQSDFIDDRPTPPVSG